MCTAHHLLSQITRIHYLLCMKADTCMASTLVLTVYATHVCCNEYIFFSQSLGANRLGLLHVKRVQPGVTGKVFFTHFLAFPTS